MTIRRTVSLVDHFDMRTLYLIILSLLTLFFSGCIENDHAFPGTLTIDAAFKEEEQIIIRSAVAEWEYATRGHVSINIVVDNIGYHPRNTWGHSEDRHTIHLTRRDSVLYERLVNAKGHSIAGWANVNDIYIFEPLELNDPELSYNILDRVVLHELGHHWGIPHPETAKDMLMDPNTKLQCIAHRDLEAFCAIYKCDAVKMINTCTNPYKKEWKTNLNYDHNTTIEDYTFK